MTERGGEEANNTHDAATPNADQGANSKTLLIISASGAAERRRRGERGKDPYETRL